jgi:protein phosphatase PTC7
LTQERKLTILSSRCIKHRHFEIEKDLGPSLNVTHIVAGAPASPSLKNQHFELLNQLFRLVEIRPRVSSAVAVCQSNKLIMRTPVLTYWLSLSALSLTDTYAFSIHPHDSNKQRSSDRPTGGFSSIKAAYTEYIPRHWSALFARKVPLASEGSWDAYLDDDGTGFVYYFNRDTGDSLWEKPTSTFPDVQLQGNLRKTAAEKQTAYLESLKAKAAKEKKGFFASILDGNKKTADDKGEEWFASLFDNKASSSSTATSAKAAATAVIEPEPSGTATKESEGFFSGWFNPPPVKDEPAPVQPQPMAGDYADANGSSSTGVASTTTTTTTTTIVTVPTPVKLEANSFVLPHPAKQLWGGEDAVLVKGRTFGVFDGVSGAEKLDGVPLYSKTLALEMKKRVPKDDSLSIQQMTKLLLECAEIADESATGASTAIVASIGTDGFLRALNVGDSTCVVIRDGKIAARTREISHYFDCPYQLSADSPDRPRDGTKLNLELVRDDVIIMGSDGVFDNLGDEQLLELVKTEPQPGRLAKRLSDMSRKVSLDRTASTPYAKQAKQWGDPDYKEGLGGKVDDASCVVVTYK